MDEQAGCVRLRIYRESWHDRKAGVSYIPESAAFRRCPGERKDREDEKIICGCRIRAHVDERERVFEEHEGQRD